MDARDTVGSVSAGPDLSRSAAVVPSRAAAEPIEARVVSDTTVEDAPVADSDAVKVDVSAESIKSEDDRLQKAAKAAQQSLDAQAADLEKTLNSKVVRFRVAVKEGDRAEMHFQVVDRETGKIVREFPPEKAHDFKDIAGLMLDTEV